MKNRPKEPGAPEEWVARAAADLALAEIEKPPGAVWESLCFHAQQAAEKAVKAVLQCEDMWFPKTHDLGALFVLVHDAGIEPPKGLEAEAGGLGFYAVVARYPGHEVAVGEEDRDSAVRTARGLVVWAEAWIRAAGVKEPGRAARGRRGRKRAR